MNTSRELYNIQKDDVKGIVGINVDVFGQEFLFIKFPQGKSYDVHHNVYTANELVNTLLFKLSIIFQKECSDYYTYAKIVAHIQFSVQSRGLNLRAETRDDRGKFTVRVRELIEEDIPTLLTLINNNRNII